tara:strand:- start:56 stop:313 length:258 start_codon:yes stop_codon:yes gene_type:complete
MAEWIYTSPDGGETVYKHRAGVGEKILVSETEKAMAERFALDEDRMVGTKAILIRKKYPGLQEAWDNYVTMWELSVTEDDYFNID